MDSFNKKIIIAIDGPAGAGKSTVSRLLARRLGIPYINTGAMYRAAGLKAKRLGIDFSDTESLKKMLDETEIEFVWKDGRERLYLDGEDVTDELYTPEAGKAASDISKVPVVREKLVELQRRIGREKGGVLEGRDIGTVVFPDADFKFFITASVEERARRRWRELQEKGIKIDYEDVLKDVEYRDKQDSSREVAPLRKADDAIEIDTTDLGIEEVLEKILKYILEQKGESSSS